MAEETGNEDRTVFDEETIKEVTDFIGEGEDGLAETPYQSALFTILATIQDNGACTELEARTALSAEGIEEYYEEVKVILASVLEESTDPGEEHIDFKGVSEALEESILEEESNEEEEPLK